MSWDEFSYEGTNAQSNKYNKSEREEKDKNEDEEEEENCMTFDAPSEPHFSLVVQNNKGDTNASGRPFTHDIILTEVEYQSPLEQSKYLHPQSYEQDTESFRYPNLASSQFSSDSSDFYQQQSHSNRSSSKSTNVSKRNQGTRKHAKLSSNDGNYGDDDDDDEDEFNNQLQLEKDANYLSALLDSNGKGSRKRKLLQITLVPRNSFSQKKIFYVFADQLINLEYLESVCQNQADKYLKDTENRSQFNGMKFITRTEHRMDTKAIEFNFEMIEAPMSDISAIVSMMQSVGNLMIYGFSERITQFWAEIIMFKQVIFNQWSNAEFQKHRIARSEHSKEVLKRLTKSIDPKKNIQYTKYIADYTKGTYDSRFSGFTAGLFELIAGNAYAFKDLLQQKGYHDAVHSKNRIDWCLQTASKYFTDQAEGSNQGSAVFLGSTPSSIVTVDKFTFPITLSITVHNLAYDYDKEHGLSFVVNDVLAIYEFTLHDDSIIDELRNLRRGTRCGEIVDTEEFCDEKNLKDKIKKTYNPEFFEKYYQDDLQTLLRRGNKWNKICGFVDIPAKKFKAITENPFTE